MFLKSKRKRYSLKNVYYLSFLFLIVFPILMILLAALLLLNQQFKEQALENVKRAQETVLSELKSDIDVMSMRLSHLIYTNNNQILEFAAGTDTNEAEQRYENQLKLSEAGNLALEPVKDIVSAGFYMKDGRQTFVKNDIKRTGDEIRQSGWYQAALANPNTVCVGSYDTVSLNDLFTGGKEDMLILVFALAPDVTTDRSEKVEMVVFYQSTKAADRIKAYNRNYLEGKNKLGITQITDSKGNRVFSTEDEEGEEYLKGGYTCVETPVTINDATWIIQNYIKTGELTADYWGTAVPVLAAAVLVLILAGYFSRYFLRSIVKPVEEISGGLRQVEEGNLLVHITPAGQYEVRNMIHQFNAMVRQLKALIHEYEERVKSVEKRPEELLKALIQGEMTAKEVNAANKEIFAERYSIIFVLAEGPAGKDPEREKFKKLEDIFERNPRFASRCICYEENKNSFYILYRIREEEYRAGIMKMLKELQVSAAKESGIHFTACIGCAGYGFEGFSEAVKAITNKKSLLYLAGENAMIDLSINPEQDEKILELASHYEKLSDALYIADEKNLADEREKLFELFGRVELPEIRIHVYAVILSVGNRFGRDHSGFKDIFGQQFNYIEKINRIEEARSLKQWLTNFFAWIMDYSASKLNTSETDVIVKAKRYMADHYEEPELSLKAVAEYAGLNEKYFTNRFTKETGETFSSYLTGLRIQKAKELLKTTTFKVYEISEMTGYNNVENFNRMFKKISGVTPAQFRKTM